MIFLSKMNSRTIMVISLKFFLLIILPALLVLGCSDRERENPLDPKGNISSPVELHLEPLDSNVLLTWSVKDLKDYTGFKIYRAISDTTSFELLTELPANFTSYTDQALDFYQWYYYRVSVLGYQTESKPSKIERTYLGPGNIYVLSRYGYSIHQYSYDLLHRIQQYNTEYPPKNWDWDETSHLIWLANAQYRSISRLNLIVGSEDFFFQENLLRPIDLKWDSLNQKLYILDSDGKKIYTLEQDILTDSIALSNDNYFKLILTPASQIATINDSNVYVYTLNGDSIAIIRILDGFTGQDLLYQNGFFYILAANESQRISKIIKYEPYTSIREEININGFFEILRRPETGNFFWCSEFIDLNNYLFVKLSEDGQRLLELSTTSSVSDMQINTKDHSVVTVQRYLNRIAIYDSSGTLINENFDIYDPIKAKIQ